MLLTWHNLHFYQHSWPRCAPPSQLGAFRAWQADFADGLTSADD